MTEKKMRVAAFIITYNEAHHIGRALSQLKSICLDTYVIDAFSNDGTPEIAERLGAFTVSNEWSGYCSQINFSINLLKDKYDWLLRVDADEYFLPASLSQVLSTIESCDDTITGICVLRSFVFMNRRLKWGGVSRLPVVRIFRPDLAYCEQRMMDERIVCEQGDIMISNLHLIDHSLGTIDQWIVKHLRYSELQAIEDTSYTSANSNISDTLIRSRTRRLYFYKLAPALLRPFAFFCYRYIIRLGLFDGIEGFYFHFFQCLWYRYLVEYKLLILKRRNGPMNPTI